MYIVKNAWKSIIRNKGRNLLMIIMALVIAVSACVSLSIREAAKKAKVETLASLKVTAQLSFDRTNMMFQMRSQQDQNIGQADRGNKGQFDRNQFNMQSLRGTALTLDDYMTYAELLGENDAYNYTLTVSMNSSEDVEPFSTEKASDNDGFVIDQVGIFGGMKGNNRFSSGDFSIVGYSSYNSMLSMFGTDGSYSITDGEMFAETSADYECIISDELAMYNDLSVGDTITLVNPSCSNEKYDVTITGIYTNASSDAGNSMFAASDPANNIYMNATALGTIISESAKLGNVSDSNEKVSAVLSAEISFTYVLASAEGYYEFQNKVSEKGLPENYELSSTDISAYEESVLPLETLATMTGWFFVIVLVVGGIILVVLNIFNLRERKYEVGVLIAIGMKKSKVALQFVCELFIITFTAIVIGTATGAVVSVPVTNSLLESQIEKIQESDDEIAQNFGRPGIGNMTNFNKPNFNKGGMFDRNQGVEVNYIDSVSSATDFTVILQLVLVGIFLTIVSSLAALITIMRYEPLKILSSRS